MFKAHARLNLFALAVAATAALIGPSTSSEAATVTLLDSDSYTSTAKVVHTIPVSASGTIKKLILSTHKEGPAVVSVKYNGVDLTMIPGTITGDQHVEGIWELDNPALSSGNIEVTFAVGGGSGSQLGLAFAALGSSNGADIAVGSVGIASNGSSPGPNPFSIDLAVPYDDSFVFVAAGGNGGSRNQVAQSPLTRLAIGSLNSMAADAGYQNGVGTSGSPHTYSFSSTADTPKIVAASFFVVPAPAALPAGLAMLALVAGRRRQH